MNRRKTKRRIMDGKNVQGGEFNRIGNNHDRYQVRAMFLILKYIGVLKSAKTRKKPTFPEANFI